ncbi:putative periplasmic sensor sensor histidine kinase [Mycobacterium ulcerans str. Harvey]|uniref:Periplasmic sensor sensor histidine kinase n=1 Tax=Mycobacterium ulcerans str. Harvey TaxID=1299332 RepID=A0ABP3AP80_MYCUL|nr:putative periplasmic sensor sensor histidine kinase [Mycobacterium ulcerans str. Harvey]
MLSEMTSDPHELANSADLDWRSVWDRGWSAAAEAQETPVQSRTDHGLPVRTRVLGWCRVPPTPTSPLRTRRIGRRRPTADYHPISPPSTRPPCVTPMRFGHP